MRLPDRFFLFSAILLSVLTYLTVRGAGTWHEEVSVHPTIDGVVLYTAPASTPETPLPMERPACGTPGISRWRRSEARPVLSLCVGSFSFPVMVTSYFSGVPYWPLALTYPLHHGAPKYLRLWGIPLAILTLWLLSRTALLFGGASASRATTLFASVLSPILYAHGLSLWYEGLPLILLLSAFLLSSRETTTPLRMTGAGLLIGFSIVANIKAIFLLAPIFVLVLRARIAGNFAPKHLAFRSLFALAVGAVLPLFFLWLVAHNDSSGGLGGQLQYRLSLVLRSGFFHRIQLEIWNLCGFWSDVGYYGELLLRGEAQRNLLSTVLQLGVFGYCTGALFWVLFRGKGPWLAGLCGALLWTFVLVTVLLYNQYPSANYTPLHGVFALAWGSLLGSLWDFTEKKQRRVYSYAVLLFAGLGVASALYNDFSRPRSLPGSFSAQAQRALGDYLQQHPEPGIPTLTATYNLAGVPDVLSMGAVRTVRAHPFFASGCFTREQEARDCLRKRFLGFFRTKPGVHRWILPAQALVVDEPSAPELLPMLHEAAEETGTQVEQVQSFSNEYGGISLVLLQTRSTR